MEQQFTLGARIDELEKQDDAFKKQDPFNKSWEDLKGYSGLDTNFKRRSTRMAKALSMPPNDAYFASANSKRTGSNGAGSKEINPGEVYRNGYGMFDVITPPWNLYELANYYDTSFANHAAIDAKVENIVGLGYDFMVSESTMLRLENNEDTEAVKRARNRIERARIELRSWLENLNDTDSFTHTLMKFYTDVQATGNDDVSISFVIILFASNSFSLELNILGVIPGREFLI